MDATTIPRGQSQEVSDGRPVNLPGKYVHKETKAVFITADGDAGILQADSLMSPVWQGQWERVGDVPTRLELQEMREAQEISDARAEKAAKEAREARIKAAVEEKTPEEKKVQKADLPEGGEYFEPTVTKDAKSK